MSMGTLLRILAAAALCCVLAPAARALAFHQAGDTLVLSGPVESEDLVRLRDHVATHHVGLVLLHQSPGGDLWIGYQLANWVRQEGLPTAVSGKCESACALIFLAGSERSFSDGLPIAQTMVGLHGAHSTATGQAMTELGPRMAWMIRTMTDRKYPPALLERTVYPHHPEDMVYAFHPGRYAAGAAGRGVLECLKQPDAAFQCRMLEGFDALGIGILTRAEVLVLPAPVKDLLRRLDRGAAAS
jgi:hypothetical protein